MGPVACRIYTGYNLSDDLQADGNWRDLVTLVGQSTPVMGFSLSLGQASPTWSLDGYYLTNPVNRQ
jgi:hypothetical protein